MDTKKGVKEKCFKIEDPFEKSQFEAFKISHGEDFVETFKIFDRNEDGTICKSELNLALCASGQNPTAKQLDDIMSNFDKNGNQHIDYEEFQYFLFKIYSNPETFRESLRDAFKFFDKDRNGFIDAREFKNIAQNLGCECLSDREVAEMIQAADINGDGLIDYEEFCKILLV